MYRATTPTHIFTFPESINPSTLQEALITYKQGSRIVIEKTLSDAVIDDQDLSVSLTQEETKLFFPGRIQLQVRVKLEDGKVPASQIFDLSAEQVLNDEVI